MKNILSKTQLEDYLEHIKNCILKEGNALSKSIEFINSNSFYEYYKTKTCPNKKTIEENLKIIEDYIPLALQQQSLDIFLSTCKETDSPYVLKSFLESSKIEFLQLINYSKNDKQKWQEIKIICETLRKQHILTK